MVVAESQGVGFGVGDVPLPGQPWAWPSTL